MRLMSYSILIKGLKKYTIQGSDHKYSSSASAVIRASSENDMVCQNMSTDELKFL